MEMHRFIINVLLNLTVKVFQKLCYPIKRKKKKKEEREIFHEKDLLK